MRYGVLVFVVVLAALGTAAFPSRSHSHDGPPAAGQSRADGKEVERKALFDEFDQAISKQQALAKDKKYAEAILANQDAERLATAIAEKYPDSKEMARRVRVLLLISRASQFLHIPRIQESIATAERAVRLASDDLGKGDWITDSARSALSYSRKLAPLKDEARSALFDLEAKANAAHEEKRLDEAIATTEQLAAKERQVLGPDEPYYANSLATIAQWSEEAGRYDAAAEKWEQALALRRKALCGTHPDILAALDGLASAERHRYRLTAAFDRYSEAVPLRRKYDGSTGPSVKGVRFDDFTVDSRKRYTISPGVLWKDGTLRLNPNASVRRTFKASNGYLVALTPEWQQPTDREASEFSLAIGRSTSNEAALAITWEFRHTEKGVAASLKLERLTETSTGIDAILGKTSWKRETIRRVELAKVPSTGTPWIVEYSYGYLTISEGGTIRLSACLDGFSDPEYWEIASRRGSFALRRCADLTWIQPAFTQAQQSQFLHANLNAARWARLLKQRKFQDTLPLAKETLKLIVDVCGPRHPTAGLWTMNLGASYCVCGDAKAAAPLEAAGIRIVETALGTHHPMLAVALRQLAAAHFDRGEGDTGVEHLRHALAVTEHSLGPDHPDTAKVLKAIGRQYSNSAQYAAAIPYFERALKICQGALGLEDVEVGILTNDLAMAYRDRGDYKSARPLFARSVAIAEKTYGIDNAEFAQAIDSTAGMYFLLGDYSNAEKLYARALSVKRRSSGSSDPGTALSMHNLATVYDAMGRYDEAEKLALEALNATNKFFGPNHTRFAEGCQLLADIYSSKGDFEKAGQYIDRVSQILKAPAGRSPETIARALVALGEIRLRAKDFRGAEAAARQSMEILRQGAGDRHPFLPEAAVLLAEAQTDAGRYQEAERSLEYAASLLKALPEVNNLNLAECIGRLGQLRMMQHRYPEGLVEFKRSLALLTPVVGQESPSLARYLHNVGDAELLVGQTQDAERSLEKAHAIFEHTQGANSSENSDLIGSLAVACLCNQKQQQAQAAFRRAIRLSVETANRLSTIQAEGQQLETALGSRALPLGGWLTSTLDGNLPGTEVWEPVLALKGTVTSRTSAAHRALRGNPVYAEYLRVGRQLSEATLKPPMPPSDLKLLAAWKDAEPELRRRWLERRNELASDFERLETQLAGNSVEFLRRQKRASVSVGDIVASLRKAPTRTALVDLQIYIHVAKTSGVNCELRLAAFVVRGDRGVRRVEMGPCIPLGRLLSDWRQRIAKSGDATPLHDDLKHAFWDPLAGHLDGIETVLISPDMEYCQLPWAALPGKKPGTYLIEDVAIGVIPAPQMLPEILNEPAKKSGPSNLLVAGDIDYGSDPGAAVPQAGRQLAQGRGGVFGQFPALPAAEPEIASIKRRFRKGGEGLEVLRGADATEARFRQDAPNYEWLHLITHGYFAPASLTAALTPQPADLLAQRRSAPTVEIGPRPGGLGAGLEIQNGKCFVSRIVPGSAAGKDGRLHVLDEIVEVAGEDKPWVSTKGMALPDIVRIVRGPAGTKVRLRVRPKGHQTSPLEYAIVREAIPGESAPRALIRPELLSGIVFAGANRPPEAGKEDGILTALDIGTLDLSKVNTVVLSACETGLGELANGESLLGLQRAFQVAGAKTVVATLWKVDDRATAALMDEFYNNVLEKKAGKLEALRRAQIRILRDYDPPQHKFVSRGLDVSPDEARGSQRSSPFYWAAFVLSGDWR